MSEKAVLQPTVAQPLATKVDKWWEKSVAPAATLPQARGKVMQTINFNLGEFDDENRTFRAVASTSVVDRQGDIIDQGGWELDNFIKNPVIPWAHDYFSPPVARAIEVGVVNGVLQFTYQAPPRGMYEFADLIWDFYRNQYMFAFSVGFIPSEAEGNTFTTCELLEVSAVVVPANPQALALAFDSGDMDLHHAKILMSKLQKTMTNLEEIIEMGKRIDNDATSDEANDLIEKAVENQDVADKLATLIEGAVEKAMNKQADATVDEAETKGALSSALPCADKGTAWDSGAATKAIKKWASNDDGDIDFSKYKKAFMYVEDGGGDKQGDYKLPFATVADDKLVAVWNGVKAIMGVLNGARGGVSISDADRKSVYTQVKKYYKKFDEDVPPLKSLDESADDVEQKGAVAEEIAADNVMEQKSQYMQSVYEVLWAFCDVYYDEDTSVDDFGALLNEAVSILQKVAAGTYNPSSPTDGSDDDDDKKPGVVVSSIRGLATPVAKDRFAKFFVKLLTGKTLNVDNMTMGKKDMSEGNSGGALTPTQMTHLKAVNDYLLNTKDLLDTHVKALVAHADTMKTHADLVERQSKGLSAHIKSVGAVLASSAQSDDSDGAAGDDNNDHLDAVNPDKELTDSARSSEKSSEAAVTKDANGEVKSEDTPTDGADQSDEEAETPTDGETEPVKEEAATEPQQPAEGETPEAPEAPAEEAPVEDNPTEGKATDDSNETEAKTAKVELTDDTVVDPDDLSDEEAEAIVRAVNEALTKK